MTRNLRLAGMLVRSIALGAVAYGLTNWWVTDLVVLVALLVAFSITDDLAKDSARHE